MTKQIRVHNNTCHKQRSHTQENFYRIFNGTVLYSVKQRTTLNFLCSNKNKVLKQTITISNRGSFKPPLGCLIKNNDILLFQSNHKQLAVNDSRNLSSEKINVNTPIVITRNNQVKPSLDNFSIDKIDVLPLKILDMVYRATTMFCILSLLLILIRSKLRKR